VHTNALARMRVRTDGLQAGKARFVNVTTDGSWSTITTDLRISHFPTLITFPPQAPAALRGCLTALASKLAARQRLHWDALASVLENSLQAAAVEHIPQGMLYPNDVKTKSLVRPMGSRPSHV
jgi:hypothetical protein